MEDFDNLKKQKDGINTRKFLQEERLHSVDGKTAAEWHASSLGWEATAGMYLIKLNDATAEVQKWKALYEKQVKLTITS